MIHLPDAGSSASSSHFSIAQKTNPSISEDRAYSSASTAENQKLSVKVYAREPIIPLPIITGICFASRTLFLVMTLRTRCVMVQKRNIIAKALVTAEALLSISGTLVLSPPANKAAILLIIRNNGAPGGCPTCSLNEARICSPQSQKLIVGSTVIRYTTADIRNISPPVILFQRRYLAIKGSIDDLF